MTFLPLFVHSLVLFQSRSLFYPHSHPPFTSTISHSVISPPEHVRILFIYSCLPKMFTQHHHLAFNYIHIQCYILFYFSFICCCCGFCLFHIFNSTIIRHFCLIKTNIFFSCIFVVAIINRTKTFAASFVVIFYLIFFYLVKLRCIQHNNLLSLESTSIYLTFYIVIEFSLYKCRSAYERYSLICK